jgi:hypothetical protein
VSVEEALAVSDHQREDHQPELVDQTQTLPSAGSVSSRARSSSNGQFTAYCWLARTFRGQVCRSGVGSVSAVVKQGRYHVKLRFGAEPLGLARNGWPDNAQPVAGAHFVPPPYLLLDRGPVESG